MAALPRKNNIQRARLRLKEMDGSHRARGSLVQYDYAQMVLFRREIPPLTPYRDTLYAARMARDLLWPEERSINLDEFVTISQTYVELPAIHPVILGRAETVRSASSTSSLLPTSFRTFTLSEDTC